MAVEGKRGCGYRKVGGLYLISLGAGRPCGKMPVPAEVCPTCDQGLKPHRGFGWIDPAVLFADRPCPTTPTACAGCPLATPAVNDLGPIGLIWAGEKFYSRPRDFLAEAARMGVSRRITAVPKGLVLGETWTAFAHRKVEFVDGTIGPGLFYLAQPHAIEKIVTASQARDAAEMEKLEARGITPVVVPDDDPDHNPGAADRNGDDMADFFDAA